MIQEYSLIDTIVTLISTVVFNKGALNIKFSVLNWQICFIQPTLHLNVLSEIWPTNHRRYQNFLLHMIIIPAFFVRKKGYINFVSKSVRLPSVRPSVRPSVTFLVNVSPPKPLEVATSNFVGE